jgi:hypothetical protein
MPAMRKHFALAFALIGLFLIAAYADWVVPDPNDLAHSYSIGRAPIWSRQFSSWQGAHVDRGEAVLLVVVLLALAGVMAFRRH